MSIFYQLGMHVHIWETMISSLVFAFMCKIGWLSYAGLSKAEIKVYFRIGPLQN